MSIVVLGGSGFIGRHLVGKLVSKGYRTISTYTSVPSAYNVAHVNSKAINEFKINLTNEESISNLFNKYSDISVVIHLAFVMDFYPDKKTANLMRRVNIEGTESLLQIIANYQRVNNRRVRLIFSSSQEAMGPVQPDSDGTRRAGTEDSTCNPEYLYGEHKRVVEQMLERQSDVDYTILRLCGVTGKGDRYGAFELIQAASRGWLLAYPGTAHGYNSFSHVSDVVDAFILAIEKEDQSKNQMFIIGSDDSLTFKQSIDVITVATGWPKPLFTIPHSVFRAIVSLIYPMYNRIRSFTSAAKQEASFLFNPKTVDCLVEDRWYSSEKAKATLGYKPMKMKEALSIACREFLEEGAICRASTHIKNILLILLVGLALSFMYLYLNRI